jgi:hypothetical protein
MRAGKLVAVILIFLAASLGWAILGGVTQARTGQASEQLGGAVATLWGQQQSQAAPTVWYLYKFQKTIRDPKTKKLVKEEFANWYPVQLSSSKVQADFRLDYRKKGLLWFSTYEVKFRARYSATNPFDRPKTMRVDFSFPSERGVYDGFVFTANGADFSAAARAEQQASRSATLQVAPKGPLDIEIGYKTRGMSRWFYEFGSGVTTVKRFTLTANTDFKNIDFPQETLSPTFKREAARGWELAWKFTSLVSGAAIGLEMPERLNPGPLASRISFFAPVSLLFFFSLLLILGLARGTNLHPMHYFLLAGAFFAFHLLFSYLVDHIDINLAFVIAAVVSLALVISYLRLVVSWHFALRTAGLAQLVFLILFSYAFFFEGYTGLTITIGAVLTLAIVMHITASVNWEETFVSRRPAS